MGWGGLKGPAIEKQLQLCRQEMFSQGLFSQSMANPGLHISHLSYFPTYLFSARSPATPPLRPGKFVTCSYRNSSRGRGGMAVSPQRAARSLPGLRASDSPPRAAGLGVGGLSPASKSRAGTRPSPRPRRPPPAPQSPPRSPDARSPAHPAPPSPPPPPTARRVPAAHSRFRFPRGLRLPPSSRRARYHLRAAPWPPGAQGPCGGTPSSAPSPPPRLPRLLLPCPGAREGSAGRKGAHRGPPAPAVGQGGYYPLHFMIKKTVD